MYENKVENKTAHGSLVSDRTEKSISTPIICDEKTAQNEIMLSGTSPGTKQLTQVNVGTKESWSRMLDDPLVTILQQEHAINRSILSNSVTMKLLRHEISLLRTRTKTN